MERQFEHIDIENPKVKQIIDAAYAEFVKYGKEKASLNHILKQANISKGVFYHYFQNKEELYAFLVEWTIEIYQRDLQGLEIFSLRDIIDRIMETIRIKVEVTNQYPYLYEFVKVIDGKEKQQLSEAYAKQYAEYLNRYLYENIDMSLLKAGVDYMTFFQMVNYSLTLATEKYLEANKREDMQIIWTDLEKELEKYTTLLRFGYYEGEEVK